MSRMEMSSVYNRIYYLDALRDAQREDRLKMLRDITAGQLACIGEVARRIYLYNRIYYLDALRDAQWEDRLKMLRDITAGQLACIGEVARRIYHQTYPLLAQDVTYFDDRSLVLRSLFSAREKESRIDPLLQDDVTPFTTLLPLRHDPGSNLFSTRILNDMTCRYPMYIEEERHRALGRYATFPWSRALTHLPR